MKAYVAQNLKRKVVSDRTFAIYNNSLWHGSHTTKFINNIHHTNFIPCRKAQYEKNNILADFGRNCHMRLIKAKLLDKTSP